jgi:hypothetical protein
MKKIKLYNRDGANLFLENTGEEVAENISKWKLCVDRKHEYCLHYMRIIGNYPNEIEAIDPSGGPMLSVGNVFEDKYEIVKINSINNIWMSERHNNN